MDDCIFCKIAQKTIPSKAIFENKFIYAFADLNPMATHHILIIPKKHISTINDVKPEDANVLGEIILGAKEIAKQLHVNDNGYRLVFNCNQDAGQTVFHIHCHLMAGQPMGWPPFPVHSK